MSVGETTRAKRASLDQDSSADGPVAPPARRDATSSDRVIVGILAAICVVAVIVVAALGGFGKRQDRQVPVNPGDVVSLGLADVKVLSASIGQSDYSDRTTATIQAEVRDTAGIQLDASSFEAALFFGYVTDTGAQKDAADWSMALTGGDPSGVPMSIIAPLDEFVPVTFTVDLGDNVSTGTVLVGLQKVVYKADWILQWSDQKTWVEDTSQSSFWVVRLAAS